MQKKEFVAYSPAKASIESNFMKWNNKITNFQLHNDTYQVNFPANLRLQLKLSEHEIFGEKSKFIGVQPHLVLNIPDNQPTGIKSLYALNQERKQEIEYLKN